MSEGSIVRDTVERILADLADPQTVNADRKTDWEAALWHTMEDNGVTLSWVPERLGGAGASFAEGFEVAGAAGRFALSVPLTETMLAGWLLSQAGIASPSGCMAIVPAHPTDRIEFCADGTLRGGARAVPFACDAAHFAVLAADASGTLIALVAGKDCRRYDGRNLAGDAQGDVVFDGVTPVKSVRAPEGFGQIQLMLMGCVVRSLQIAGALQSALTRSIDYAGERMAFGRRIGQFQAVQNNLARLAGEVAAAAAAAGSAADMLATAQTWDDGVFLEAAAAKIRCAEAAGIGVGIAHQVHGAIGLTLEYVLHRFTLRALSWREDFGNESYWAVELGNRIAMRGAGELWPLVASR